mmetsp:Transcript_8169/g.22739  ORF Transcript_8169/g.22739 Transcript_8169/m.22739 type:complete len:230 (+) Transcript_8169:58-747(+)
MNTLEHLRFSSHLFFPLYSSPESFARNSAAKSSASGGANMLSAVDIRPSVKIDGGFPSPLMAESTSELSPATTSSTVSSTDARMISTVPPVLNRKSSARGRGFFSASKTTSPTIPENDSASDVVIRSDAVKAPGLPSTKLPITLSAFGYSLHFLASSAVPPRPSSSPSKAIRTASTVVNLCSADRVGGFVASLTPILLCLILALSARMARSLLTPLFPDDALDDGLENS